MSENGRSLMDDIILACLHGRPTAFATRKEIQKWLNSSAHDVTESSTEIPSREEIKHALKRLVKQGAIMKRGKEFSLVRLSGVDAADAHLDVPIAVTQRRKNMSLRVTDNAQERGNGENELMDLDEEIRRLEEDLAADTTDSDDGEEEENDDDDDCIAKDSEQIQNGVICLSNLASDRIEPLPQNVLPQNKRRKLKGVDSVPTFNTSLHGSHERKKQKRHNSSSDQQQQPKLRPTITARTSTVLLSYMSAPVPISI